MEKAKNSPIDPNLDLLLERIIDVPRDLVWSAWTTPEHIKHWFTPKPWQTIDCEIDLRPGGIFRTTMRSPEGQDYPNIGCFLEVVPKERLAWTDALLPGFRPHDKGFMTAVISLEDHPTGTKYSALAKHKDDVDRKKHEEMGFYNGWATALDQMVAYIKTLS